MRVFTNCWKENAPIYSRVPSFAYTYTIITNAILESFAENLILICVPSYNLWNLSFIRVANIWSDFDVSSPSFVLLSKFNANMILNIHYYKKYLAFKFILSVFCGTNFLKLVELPGFNNHLFCSKSWHKSKGFKDFVKNHFFSFLSNISMLKKVAFEKRARSSW